jgi:hypothetical protein
MELLDDALEEGVTSRRISRTDTRWLLLLDPLSEFRG